MSRNIQSRKEAEEFPSKKGIILCSDCGAAHFKKRWVHGLEKLKLSEKNDSPVSNGLCPACSMIKNGQYEGRITIKGFPEDSAQELEGLVRGYAERAYDRDPMHRVIDINKDGQHWVITTTENELANKLAQKIKSAFSKAKSRTKFAPEPSDVAEVVIDFEK